MLDFHWFLPTYGDSRDIVGGGHGQPAGAARSDRPATLKYLTSLASAADDGLPGTVDTTCFIDRIEADAFIPPPREPEASCVVPATPAANAGFCT